MNKILVSVLMTAYNREEFIGEAIESVLASTFQDFELIIVDDCSTDNTREIAKKYAEQNEKVSLYVNEVNIGQFKNRNKAVTYSKATYIKFFDSDDIMNNNLLAVTMDAMLTFHNASMGVECTWPKILREKLPVLFTSREAYINHYFKGNDFLHFGPSSSILKRSLFNETGGYDESIGILADTLLMLQMAAKSPVVGYEPNLFIWRRHEGQVTVEQDNYYLMFKQRHQITSLILESACPLSAAEKNTVRQNFKNIFIRNTFKYIKSIRNLQKLYSMFKIMEIRPVDFFLAFFKNKIIQD